MQDDDLEYTLNRAEVDVAKLRLLIVEHFSEADLRNLAFDLRVDYDELAGGRKSDKARELVAYFMQRRRVDVLLSLLAEERPFVTWTAVTLETSDEPPPFKGLQPFSEEDADIFFGREAIVSDLLGRLSQGNHFLAVVGASGSGKSSLVKAGILPYLRRGKRLEDGTMPPIGSDRWPVHIITPGTNPLEALATTLTQKADSVTATTTLINDLMSDSRTLHLYARRLVMSMPGRPERLLLYIDQFEEIFTLTYDEMLRQTFIENLMTAVTAPESQTTLLITLRADFYAECSQYESLRQQLEVHQKFLGANDYQ